MSYLNLIIYIEEFFYIEIYIPSFSFNGGKIPLNNSHSVIDRPELVNRVNPPTIIIKKTKIKEIDKPIKK